MKISEVYEICKNLFMERYSPYEIKKACSKIENVGLKLEIDPNSVEAYNFYPLEKITEVFFAEKLSDVIGIEGITFQPIFSENPKILVFDSSNEIILPHELVHSEFSDKHDGGGEFKNLIERYCGPLIRFLNGEEVETIEVLSSMFKLPVYYEKFRELHKDFFELSETYAWLVTKKIRPDIKIPSSYGDVVDVVEKCKSLPLKKIKCYIYKSYTLKDFTNKLKL